MSVRSNLFIVNFTEEHFFYQGLSENKFYVQHGDGQLAEQPANMNLVNTEDNE